MAWLDPVHVPQDWCYNSFRSALQTIVRLRFSKTRPSGLSGSFTGGVSGYNHSSAEQYVSEDDYLSDEQLPKLLRALCPDFHAARANTVDQTASLPSALDDTVRQMSFAWKSLLQSVTTSVKRDPTWADAILLQRLLLNKDGSAAGGSGSQTESLSLMSIDEMEDRTLYSAEELQTACQWVRDPMSPERALAGAKLIANTFCNDSNQFGLTRADIARTVTNKDTGCLPSLLSFVQAGQIKLYVEIPPEDLIYGDEIGTGTAGSVMRATWRGKPVAVKKFKGVDLGDFLKELSIMSIVQHPNLVECYGGCSRNKDTMYIVQELMDCNISDVLRLKPIILDIGIRLRIAIEVSKGMSFLHTHCNLIHRDLKSLNLLASVSDADFTVKICDFGVSRVVDRRKTMTGNVGTVSWIAPEVFEQRKYTEKADVYSFGIVLWELLTRRVPFADIHSFSIPVAVIKGDRPSIPKDSPSALKKLIRECWQPKASKRPPFSKVVEFLSKILDQLPPNQKQQTSFNIAPLMMRKKSTHSNLAGRHQKSAVTPEEANPAGGAAASTASSTPQRSSPSTPTASSPATAPLAAAASNPSSPGTSTSIVAKDVVPKRKHKLAAAGSSPYSVDSLTGIDATTTPTATTPTATTPTPTTSSEAKTKPARAEDHSNSEEEEESSDNDDVAADDGIADDMPEKVARKLSNMKFDIVGSPAVTVSPLEAAAEDAEADRSSSPHTTSSNLDSDSPEADVLESGHAGSSTMSTSTSSMSLQRRALSSRNDSILPPTAHTRTVTCSVPDKWAPPIAKLEVQVNKYFSKLRQDLDSGTITVNNERYLLFRAKSLAVDFFNLVQTSFNFDNSEQSLEFAQNFLYDLGTAIGKSDALHFLASAGIEDPVARNNAGLVHIAYTGMAFIKLLPESVYSKHPEDECLLCESTYSFESDSWKNRDLASASPNSTSSSPPPTSFCTCMMSAGYLSGWGEGASGNVRATAEISCRSKGDPTCLFVRALPLRLEHMVRKASGGNADPLPKFLKNRADTTLPAKNPNAAVDMETPGSWFQQGFRQLFKRSKKGSSPAIGESVSGGKTPTKFNVKAISPAEMTIEEIDTRASRELNSFFIDPTTATIEMVDERCVLLRGDALARGFYQMVQELFGFDDEGQLDSDADKHLSRQFAFKFLFDLGKTIAASNQSWFSERIGLPANAIERINSLPVNMAYFGWCDLIIRSGHSHRELTKAKENFVIVCEVANSFEAASWSSSSTSSASSAQSGSTSPTSKSSANDPSKCPVCFMHAGYLSGWFETALKTPCVAVETSCAAQTGGSCFFTIAHSSNIKKIISSNYPSNTSLGVNTATAGGVLPLLAKFKEKRRESTPAKLPRGFMKGDYGSLGPTASPSAESLLAASPQLPSTSSSTKHRSGSGKASTGEIPSTPTLASSTTQSQQQQTTTTTTTPSPKLLRSLQSTSSDSIAIPHKSKLKERESSAMATSTNSASPSPSPASSPSGAPRREKHSSRSSTALPPSSGGVSTPSRLSRDESFASTGSPRKERSSKLPKSSRASDDPILPAASSESTTAAATTAATSTAISASVSAASTKKVFTVGESTLVEAKEKEPKEKEPKDKSTLKDSKEHHRHSSKSSKSDELTDVHPTSLVTAPAAGSASSDMDDIPSPKQHKSHHKERESVESPADERTSTPTTKKKRHRVLNADDTDGYSSKDDTPSRRSRKHEDREKDKEKTPRKERRKQLEE